jgi:hypothetical protein
MLLRSNNGDENIRSDMRPHEQFLELCAVSTTGELSEDELATLKQHLAICAECRQVLSEFETAASVGAPLLSSALVVDGADELGPAHEEADMRGSVVSDHLPSASAETVPFPRDNGFIIARRDGNHNSRVNWNYVWLPFAAAILLTAALAIYSYQAGTRQSPQVAQKTNAGAQTNIDALEQRLSDAGHEREVLRAQLADRDKTIRELQRRIDDESVALDQEKNTQANLEHSLQDALDQKQQLAQQQASTSQNLDTAQASLKKVQAEVDLTRQQRDQDEAEVGSLEGQIRDLNAQLRQNEQTVGEQQDLLAEDRDIRDLMGARDLYIAEVYDVARDGATQKPYGRVFYTKGKSLVFYAYDLDRQPGVKDASTFQAWGQSGPDRQQVLSLGIFYQDGAAKKRWVLKFDDPRALEQINTVFVTVEPHGGSHKPSGKPLLFASLKIEPNHP